MYAKKWEDFPEDEWDSWRFKETGQIGIKADQGYVIYHHLLPKESATNLDIALVLANPGRETFLLGTASFYSGVVGFVTKLSVKFYNTLKEADLEETRGLSDIFEKFYNLCFIESSCKLIAHYKVGFEYFGWEFL